jgi:hypothetical protein
VSIGDFLRLPPGVRIAFLAMIWPAIWAAALTAVALAADIQRQIRGVPTLGGVVSSDGRQRGARVDHLS